MVTDLSGTRLDEDVQTCDAGGWTLVTSRDPDDLDAFVAAAAAVLT